MSTDAESQTSKSAGQICLTTEQSNVLYSLQQNSLVILTGGPGTGKTTTLREVVLQKQDADLALCAPTGKAARRMEQAVAVPGVRAQTVHRLLAYSPKERRFMRDADDPLTADLVVCDEASMLSIPLAHALFSAITPDTKVLLVGDDQQLPPVGPGYVLRDLIASERVPTTRLSLIHRQADLQGGIVGNAHRVINGELPIMKAQDFTWSCVEDAVEIKDIIKDLPLAQMLIPQKKGGLGVREMNTWLKSLRNPGNGLPNRRLPNGEVVHPGDVLMQCRNDYDLDIFNGYTGVVKWIDLEDSNKPLCVDFGDGCGPIIYRSEQDMQHLRLAYAATIHKSQGSEFDRVVIILHPSHWFMLERNLLYTAITRAKQHCHLIGPERAVKQAVKNNRPAKRQTRLKALLQGKL